MRSLFHGARCLVAVLATAFVTLWGSRSPAFAFSGQEPLCPMHQSSARVQAPGVTEECCPLSDTSGDSYAPVSECCTGYVPAEPQAQIVAPIRENSPEQVAVEVFIV